MALLAFQTYTSAQQLKPGDKVLASPTMMSDEKYYKSCTVVRFDAGAGSYRVDCEGTEYSVPKAYVRPGTPGDFDNKPPVKDTPPVVKDPPPAGGNNGGGKYKVGDRVLVSITGLKDEKYYEPCTITRGLKSNSYGIKCDKKSDKPVKEEISVLPEWIKDWPDATPEPPDPTCSFDETPGTVTRTSPPSDELFRRLIYLVKGKEAGGRQYGVKFENFQRGAVFKNSVYDFQGNLRFPAPKDAPIYPVDTRIIYCVKYADSTQRFVIQARYGCFKNTAGEWTCGTDTAKTLQHDYIPNK